MIFDLRLDCVLSPPPPPIVYVNNWLLARGVCQKQDGGILLYEYFVATLAELQHCRGTFSPSDLLFIRLGALEEIAGTKEILNLHDDLL
jgi:hypothetical protein